MLIILDALKTSRLNLSRIGQRSTQRTKDATRTKQVVCPLWYSIHLAIGKGIQRRYDNAVHLIFPNCSSVFDCESSRDNHCTGGTTEQSGSDFSRHTEILHSMWYNQLNKAYEAYDKNRNGSKGLKPHMLLAGQKTFLPFTYV